MYQSLYDWVRANAPDTRLEDLPVVPLAGFLQTGAEVGGWTHETDTIMRQPLIYISMNRSNPMKSLFKLYA